MENSLYICEILTVGRLAQSGFNVRHAVIKKLLKQLCFGHVFFWDPTVFFDQKNISWRLSWEIRFK